MVSIDTLKGLSERDFIFELVSQRNLIMYAHLVDSRIAGVLVKNEIDNVIQISKRLRLDMLCEVDYENVFFAEAGDLLKASTKKDSKPSATTASFSWIKKAATIAIAASISLAGSLSQLTHVGQAGVVNANVGAATETKLSNDVMVYDNSQDIKILSNLVNEFPTLWKDESFVNISEKDWMKLSLRDDWQSRLSKSNRVKIYSLDINDRAVIDETFDNL